MLTENYRAVDVFADFWEIHGEVREYSYKIKSLIKMINYTDVVETDTMAYNKMVAEKWELTCKLENISLEHKKIECKIQEIEITDDLIAASVIISKNIIECLRIGEKMQRIISETYKYMIISRRTTQLQFREHCKDEISPSLGLIDFYNRCNFCSSKDLDRIDQIDLIVESTPLIQHNDFKTALELNGITNDFQHLFRIRNYKEHIERLEEEYKINLEYSVMLGKQFEKEALIKQNKKLNYSMLVLALIGGIGVLSNAINIGDNIAITLTILILLLAFSKWLTL
ncbi:MAG: hypothetical protein VB113_16285 [Acetobacterium wieringae]|nr:hypothetical protein [Acetobacterium wieringae]